MYKLYLPTKEFCDFGGWPYNDNLYLLVNFTTSKFWWSRTYKIRHAFESIDIGTNFIDDNYNFDLAILLAEADSYEDFCNKYPEFQL